MQPSHPKPLKRKAVREITPTYWRTLIELGVPIDAANAIAWTVARYDAARRLPDAHQKLLLTHYCPHVCRAGLWRPQLLLTDGI